MSIRTTTRWTCPIAGWLTISAGERAVDGPTPELPARCNRPPRPKVSGDGAEVPGFAELRARNADGRYSADIGLLGDTVTSAGGCITAVGRGAALAAADSSGRLPSYLALERTAGRRRRSTRCDLTIVDAGSLVPPTLTRPEDAGPVLRRLVAADKRVGDVVAAAPTGATVIVVGMADRSTTPHLTVATARGPGPDGSPYDERWLTARSTRRTALVQLTDVLPTVLGLLGLDQPSAAIGSQVRPDGLAPAADGRDRRARRRGHEGPGRQPVHAALLHPARRQPAAALRRGRRRAAAPVGRNRASGAGHAGDATHGPGVRGGAGVDVPREPRAVVERRPPAPRARTVVARGAPRGDGDRSARAVAATAARAVRRGRR